MIYPLLLPAYEARRRVTAGAPLPNSGRIGLGWGSAGGEVGGLLIDNYLAADGIVNILRVLEETGG